MAKPRIGVLKGTMLRPSVSKNRRRYTSETIAAAHKRLTAKLSGEGLPVTMMTSHG